MSEGLVPHIGWEGFSNNSDWEGVNYQPARAKENQQICPNYQIIELCAELTGTSPDKLGKESRFCGREKRTTMGELRGWPKVLCWEIQKTLALQIATVEKKTKKPTSEETALRQLRSEKTIDKMAQSLVKYKTEKEEFEEREDILNRFKQVIFENCFAHKGDESEKNPHISAISSPNDLSDKVALERVIPFLGALENTTGRKYNPVLGNIDISEVTHPAKNCKQCPVSIGYNSHRFPRF